MQCHSRPGSRRDTGFTFVELVFGVLLFAIGGAVLIGHLTANYRSTLHERDRVFAYAKAQAMLAEIQGWVDRGQSSASIDLDVLDDGVLNKSTLTIATDAAGNLVPPDHVLSGNFERDGAWVWSRRITVQPFAGLGNRNVRYVTVRVFRKDGAGRDLPMADLSAVVNTASSAFPTTQVFDVWLLAIENIPGWWVFMDSIKPFVESMITDLEARNPGLAFRTHWITKASFGRNEAYRPYVNEAADSLAPIPGVYHYPGRMPAGSASTYYYVPDNIAARIDLDGVETNGWDAVRNPHPYALADFFNHAMRHPDELALWQRRVAAVQQRRAEIAAAVAANTPPPPELDDMSTEPTLRLFLEDLYSAPDKYRNALVVNLHGELLPMPALRNYSDAARDPVNVPNVRCVTHPEELRTARNAATPGSSDPLRLRVYAYAATTADDAATFAPDRMPVPMVVEVVGLDLTDPSRPGALGAACALQCLRGGVPVGGSSEYAPFAAAKRAGDPTLLPGEMYYRAEFVDPGVAGAERCTRIFLHNTPVIAPYVSTRGLAPTERAHLYWMPYVPCPVEAARDFSTDLASPGAGPKNTARWCLTIAPAVFTNDAFVDRNGVRHRPAGDVVVEVRTRVWAGADPATSGTMWPPSARNAPDNLSTTYAWWADSAEDVPITERSQFNGDPRHCPYKDLFAGAAEDYPNGYNWYHDALANASEPSASNYPSIAAANLRNRWQGAMACDVPRYFELLRKGLTRSACVYTTLTGFSYYYVGIGNDVGYDADNGYPSSIPCNLVPYGGAGPGYVDTITGARRLVRSSASRWWWGMPWLGELYPDAAAAAWSAASGGAPRGNLDPGTGAGRFWQGAANDVYAPSVRTAYGTAMLDHHQRTAVNGCTAFFDVGSPTATFHHAFATGNGTLTTVGTELARNYNLTMPTSAPITRPFGLAWGGGAGDEFGFAPYTTRYAATLLQTYYTHPQGTGSGLVKLVDPGNTTAAYVVVNGIDKTVGSGTTFIAKWALLSLVHSFFAAGDTANSLRVPQLPRLEILHPTEITELDRVEEIEVRFDVAWRRWDGLPYTRTGTFAEDERELEYVLAYSRDNGASWLHVADGSAARPGERPAPAYLSPDAAPGPETRPWAVPAAEFPEGSYLLRIDCFRRGAQVHYACHQTKIFLQR